MVHAYHVVLPHYGFWVPNYPRGSWSMFVARWELARFRKTTRPLKQRTLEQRTPQEIAFRDATRKVLQYQPLRNSPETTLTIFHREVSAAGR